MEKVSLIVALDVDTIKQEERLIKLLVPYIKTFKIGGQLFTSCGPKAIELIKGYGAEVFLDLKFHDIPNTVRAASKVITRYGVFMFNVHTFGGTEMMSAAIEGATEEAEVLGIDRPKVLGVTVLTSMENSLLKDIGIKKDIKEEVLELAGLAKRSGLDGVIASPQEIDLIRQRFGKDFLIVTPGIRLEGSFSNDDQKRTMTPREAKESGADYIVVGRPIIKAKDPLEIVTKIKKELQL